MFTVRHESTDTPQGAFLVVRSCAPRRLSAGQHSAVKTSPLPSSRLSDELLRRRYKPTHTTPSSPAGLNHKEKEKKKENVDGCAHPERSSAPQESPNGGVSEDATPQFHLCVGVSVHGRDHGSSVPQLHVPLSWRPNLAGAHAPLHARTVRARPADSHLHPPGPEQGQTAGSAAAHPAARTHCQVSLFISTVSKKHPQVSCPR